MSLDPRYLIARETGFADHDIATGRHGVILEFVADGGLRASDSLRAVRAALSGSGDIEPAYDHAVDGLRLATAWVGTDGLSVLETLVQEGQHLRRFEYAQNLWPPRLRPMAPLRPQPVSPESDGADTPAAGTGPVRIVHAVIDHGCPFMHPLLCRSTTEGLTTRVRALWDQQSGPPAASAPPTGFSYGTALTRAQLDAVMRIARGDEDVAYRALGYDALRRRQSHGAHALGMLLDDRTRLRRPGAELDRGDVLFVQLPYSLLGAPYRAALSRYLIDALVWIEAQRQPDECVVLSLGHGSSQGPHDGSSMVERALQDFASRGPHEAARNRVYLAAGNGCNERLHAQQSLQPGASCTLLWRLPPGSEMAATMELWLPLQGNGHPGDVDIELRAPDGRLAGLLRPGASLHWPTRGQAVVSMVSSSWTGQSCTLSLLRIGPTAIASVVPRAASGDWQVRVTSRSVLAGPIHAYIARIKPALGLPLRTTQSTFVPTERDGYLGPESDGTLQGLATADGVVRAGGHVGLGNDPSMADYSGRGPSRDGRVVDPDIDVRVDDGAVLHGRRSIGNQGGVTFRMDGTSVAAPLAARLDLLARPVPETPPPSRGQTRPVPKPPGGSRRLVDPFDG